MLELSRNQVLCTIKFLTVRLISDTTGFDHRIYQLKVESTNRSVTQNKRQTVSLNGTKKFSETFESRFDVFIKFSGIPALCTCTTRRTQNLTPSKICCLYLTVLFATFTENQGKYNSGFQPRCRNRSARSSILRSNQRKLHFEFTTNPRLFFFLK